MTAMKMSMVSLYSVLLDKSVYFRLKTGQSQILRLYKCDGLNTGIVPSLDGSGDLQL
jgi:hypothetical protein